MEGVVHSPETGAGVSGGGYAGAEARHGAGSGLIRAGVHEAGPVALRSAGLPQVRQKVVEDFICTEGCTPGGGMELAQP